MWRIFDGLYVSSMLCGRLVFFRGRLPRVVWGVHNGGACAVKDLRYLGHHGRIIAGYPRGGCGGFYSRFFGDVFNVQGAVYVSVMWVWSSSRALLVGVCMCRWEEMRLVEYTVCGYDHIYF